jgi:hypothetical protein
MHLGVIPRRHFSVHPDLQVLKHIFSPVFSGNDSISPIRDIVKRFSSAALFGMTHHTVFMQSCTAPIQTTDGQSCEAGGGCPQKGGLRKGGGQIAQQNMF